MVLIKNLIAQVKIRRMIRWLKEYLFLLGWVNTNNQWVHQETINKNLQEKLFRIWLLKSMTLSKLETDHRRKERPWRMLVKRKIMSITLTLILFNQLHLRKQVQFTRIFRRLKTLDLQLSHNLRLIETHSVNRVRLVQLVEPNWERSEK